MVVDDLSQNVTAAREACQGLFYHEKCHMAVTEALQVLIVFVVMVMSIVALFFVDSMWRNREKDSEKATGILNQSHAYAVNLVKHFMPTMKVSKYQFRGMQPPTARIDITFNRLGLELPNGQKVLNGVTGEFQSGRMCAIMGPSGAGKTTFMNVLCGKATYGKTSGTILVNGFTMDITKINSVTGFVPQDDIVHETLTVREQIRFAAVLRNKVGTSMKRVDHITDDVLNVMQIDHIQNSIVGGVTQRGISGGQRKRVNIGLELAGQPTLLFLDEPTSGLDSTSSLSVVYSLKKMCQLGMTCIMVIHQPRYSLFTLFDDVLLLGKGGNTVYLGNSNGAKDYFDDLGFLMAKDENRADWFMDVISGEVPNTKIPNFEVKMLFDLWEKHKGKDGEANGRPNGNSNGNSNGHPTPAVTVMGSRTGRDLSQTEEVAVLTRALMDEWEIIDVNRDGFLDNEELKALLTRCSKLEPSEEVVQELLLRMAGPDAGVVTREEFIKYLCTLQGDIAKDMLTEKLDEGRNGMEGVGDNVRQALLAVVPVRLTTLQNDDMSETNEEAKSPESSSDSDTDEEAGYAPKKGLHALARRVPGYSRQFRILFVRTLIQWWRKNPSRIIFYTAMACGALVLAGQDILCNSPKWDAMGLVNTHTAVGLLLTIYSLNVFGENQPVFWRERNRGLNVWAYFQSKANLNLIDLWMQCFLFTALYYMLRQIHVPFLVYWVPYLLTAYAASGWGYALSAWLPSQHGPFVGCLVIFVVCGLLGNPMSLQQFLTNPLLEAMVSLISITRWSIPMSFLEQVNRTNPHPEDMKQQMTLDFYHSALTAGTWSNRFGYWWSGVFALCIYGSVLRGVAFVGLLVTNRDKMV